MNAASAPSVEPVNAKIAPKTGPNAIPPTIVTIDAGKENTATTMKIPIYKKYPNTPASSIINFNLSKSVIVSTNPDANNP